MLLQSAFFIFCLLFGSTNIISFKVIWLKCLQEVANLCIWQHKVPLRHGSGLFILVFNFCYYFLFILSCFILKVILLVSRVFDILPPPVTLSRSLLYGAHCVLSHHCFSLCAFILLFPVCLLFCFVFRFFWRFLLCFPISDWLCLIVLSDVCLWPVSLSTLDHWSDPHWVAYYVCIWAQPCSYSDRGTIGYMVMWYITIRLGVSPSGEVHFCSPFTLVLI